MSAPEPGAVPEQHWDHDIHGPVIEVWPDGATTLDPDCDCPADCPGCEREGVGSVTAPDPECPLSELPASQCACHRHRGGTPPAAEVETVGQPFQAAYTGVCERCDGRIIPGHDIARVADGGGYVHARECPR
jgi:hypothetical protein